MINKIKIYCDGSCSYKTRFGGLGVYIIDQQGKEFFFKKGFSDTTISRMELMAFLTGLEKINKDIPCEVRIVSDSEYVILAFTRNRINKWNDNHWCDTKNLDLWLKIIEVIEDRPLMRLIPIHIRGHQKDLSIDDVYGNNVADALADIRFQGEFIVDKQEKVKGTKLEFFSSNLR